MSQLTIDQLKDVERIVKKLLDRLRKQQSGDDPDSLIPASLKPRPPRNSGKVALPEPED